MITASLPLPPPKENLLSCHFSQQQSHQGHDAGSSQPSRNAEMALSTICVSLRRCLLLGCVTELSQGQHLGRSGDLEQGGNRDTVGLEEMELVTVCGVKVDTPDTHEFSLVVVFDEVGDSATRSLDLLVAIAVGNQSDRTVVVELIVTVHPEHDSSDAIVVGGLI